MEKKENKNRTKNCIGEIRTIIKLHDKWKYTTCKIQIDYTAVTVATMKCSRFFPMMAGFPGPES
uniref:Uncharacterized protein n=1 Tax=Romanomermis culicivorax TaxID=13658 RepID=A0A915KGV0_ROMCU